MANEIVSVKLEMVPFLTADDCFYVHLKIGRKRGDLIGAVRRNPNGTYSPFNTVLDRTPEFATVGEAAFHDANASDPN